MIYNEDSSSSIQEGGLVNSYQRMESWEEDAMMVKKKKPSIRKRIHDNSFFQIFMGESPRWYKWFIIGCLVVNPPLFFINNVVAGWCLVCQFILTLAMALDCYPLQPGGLLAIEATFIGMTTPTAVLHEIEANIEVILLLVFMVAATHFLKSLLMYIFTVILLKIRSKIVVSLLFTIASALLSAFLDALTVTAVLITVSMGFHAIFTRSDKYMFDTESEEKRMKQVEELRKDREEFLSFLMDILMHSVVGTALGGALTPVGEPQNLIIANLSGWGFLEFFMRMGPVTWPVFVVGLIVVTVLERFKLFGYGSQLPPKVLQILKENAADEDDKRTDKERAALVVQAMVSLFIVLALGTQVAAVGVVGLAAIVLLTVFQGITEEHDLGHAFTEALPFTALLAVFFAVVAVIEDQGLFEPIISWVLGFEGLQSQISMFYLVTGVLSMISDNVFVATIYINELVSSYKAGVIDRYTYDILAVAVNTGTNILSVATPNGQAAFLYLLTSSVAPVIKLTYVKMVYRILPYTIVMSITGWFGAFFLLDPVTRHFMDNGIIPDHDDSQDGGEMLLNLLGANGYSPLSFSDLPAFDHVNVTEWLLEHNFAVPPGLS